MDEAVPLSGRDPSSEQSLQVVHDRGYTARSGGVSPMWTGNWMNSRIRRNPWRSVWTACIREPSTCSTQNPPPIQRIPGDFIDWSKSKGIRFRSRYPETGAAKNRLGDPDGRREAEPSGRWFASLRPIFDSRNNIFVSKILFSVRVSIIFNLFQKMRKRVDRKFRIRYDRKSKNERKGGRTMSANK